MIADILTVMWKERKGLFSQRGSRIQGILTLLVPVAVFAVWLPWQEGSRWFESFLVFVPSVFIPMLLVMLTIPESFAGERERHTLETLLASRLPDRAILFGKISMSVGLAWIMTLLTLFISFVIANITHWEGQLMFYTPAIALVSIALSFLVATLSASVGVLISLRAATVRQAQQTLMATTMFPILLLGVAGTFVFTIEGWGERLQEIIAAIDSTLVIIIVVTVLVVACTGLLWAAMARFRRARLILSR